MIGSRLIACAIALSALLGAAAMPRGQALAQASEQAVVLAPGERAIVDLVENPSTGYVWRFDAQRSDNAGILKIDDQGHSQPAGERPPIGAPGRHRWSLEGLSAGRARLIFINLRPWEDRPVREHAVAVEVR